MIEPEQPEPTAGSPGYAVELHLGDSALAGRIAEMLGDRPEIEIVTTEGDVVIADPVQGCRWADRPCLVLIADVSEARGLIEAGVLAILPASARFPDILLALDAIARGFALFPKNLLGAAVGAAQAPKPAGVSKPDLLPDFTPREGEVLGLLAEGASNKMIARRLGISVHTAKFHVASILDKLDAIGRTDAVAQAARLGVLLL